MGCLIDTPWIEFIEGKRNCICDELKEEFEEYEKWLGEL